MSRNIDCTHRGLNEKLSLVAIFPNWSSISRLLFRNSYKADNFRFYRHVFFSVKLPSVKSGLYTSKKILAWNRITKRFYLTDWNRKENLSFPNTFKWQMFSWQLSSVLHTKDHKNDRYSFILIKCCLSDDAIENLHTTITDWPVLNLFLRRTHPRWVPLSNEIFSK